MIKIEELKFDEKGLIPAIVVDTDSKKVLTLAYMNAESLAITLEEKKTCFYSRSRQTLWRKGETSGTYQHVISVTADCDKDALMVEVKKDGPACHTGSDSCFFNPLYVGESTEKFSLEGLYGLLMQRKTELPQGSYTTYLFEKGVDIYSKKWERKARRSLSPVKPTIKRKPFTKSPTLPITCSCLWRRWALR